MHSTPTTLSRRAWLHSSAVAGLAFWGGSAWEGVWAQNSPAAEPKKPEGFGPAPKWLDSSREHIRNNILPAPTGTRLTEQIARSSRAENVFYLDLGKHALVIDAGYHHQIDHHLDNFEKLGCDLGKVVAILGTHFHVDHTGGVKRARERLDVPLVMHPRSVEPLSTGDRLVTAAVIPEIDGWEFEYPPCDVDETVDEGDIIAVGDEKIVVRHLPGHTPDSLGFIWRNYFFTGDVAFNGGATGWSSPRWYSNYVDHIETMHRLIASPPPVEKFHPAHGGEHPYSDIVPKTCLERLVKLQQREDDPCNHTAQVKRRTAEDSRRVLRLPG